MAWLTTIARHRAIDLMRKRKPETPLHRTDADGQPRQHDRADERASPLQQLVDLQADNQLQHCMATLDDAPRQAITLAYAEGLTHDQLALRLRRPLGTIKAWIRRRLPRLRDCLAEAAGAQGNRPTRCVSAWRGLPQGQRCRHELVGPR